MKNYVRFTPELLEMKSRTIAPATEVYGPVLPWRSAHNFRTFVALITMDSGTPNFHFRYKVYDWDKVERSVNAINILFGATAVPNGVWVKDNTARATQGTLSNVNAALAFPFIQFGIFNNDVASAVYNLEITLFDGMGF